MYGIKNMRLYGKRLCLSILFLVVSVAIYLAFVSRPTESLLEADQFWGPDVITRKLRYLGSAIKTQENMMKHVITHNQNILGKVTDLKTVFVNLTGDENQNNDIDKGKYFFEASILKKEDIAKM